MFSNHQKDLAVFRIEYNALVASKKCLTQKLTEKEKDIEMANLELENLLKLNDELKVVIEIANKKMKAEQEKAEGVIEISKKTFWALRTGHWCVTSVATIPCKGNTKEKKIPAWRIDNTSCGKIAYRLQWSSVAFKCSSIEMFLKVKYKYCLLFVNIPAFSY